MRSTFSGDRRCRTIRSPRSSVRRLTRSVFSGIGRSGARSGRRGSRPEMARPLSKKPTLRAALLAKLGNPDRFQLRRLADGARARYGPMSPADACAVLASEKGIPIHKYLTGDDLTRVRGIMAGGPAPAAPDKGNGRRSRTKTEIRLKEIVIGGVRFTIDDPIVPARVATEVNLMAGVYPLTYVFENSVREVVRRVMEKKHGPDWFKQ